MQRVFRRGLTAIAVVAALLAVDGPSVQAQPVASITLPAPGATKQLYPGCNNISLTFPNGTTSQEVVQAVTPAGSIQAMWRHNAALNRFDGFAPAAPQASDLLSVNFLDSVWLCVAAAPPPPSTAPPAAPTAAPAPPAPAASLTPIVFESGDGKDRNFHLDTSRFRMEWTVDIKGLTVLGETTEGTFNANIRWWDQPGLPTGGFTIPCGTGQIVGIGVKSGTEECSGGPGEFDLWVQTLLVNSWRVTITPLPD
jgi:hypothetical protein